MRHCPSKDSFIEVLADAPYSIRQGILGAAYLMTPRRLPNLPFLVLRGLPGRVGRWHVDPALTGGDWDPATTEGIRRSDVQPNGSACPWHAAEMLAARPSNTW